MTALVDTTCPQCNTDVAFIQRRLEAAGAMSAAIKRFLDADDAFRNEPSQAGLRECRRLRQDLRRYRDRYLNASLFGGNE